MSKDFKVTSWMFGSLALLVAAAWEHSLTGLIVAVVAYSALLAYAAPKRNESTHGVKRKR